MVERFGEEAVRQGSYPRVARHGLDALAEEPVDVAETPTVVAKEAIPDEDGSTEIAEEPASQNGKGRVDPAGIRPALAEVAARSVNELGETLLDAALNASRPTWVTVPCPNCGVAKRHEVSIPDVRSRVAAIELLLREGLGRAPQAEETPTPRLPRTAEAVEKLSWVDMQTIFAAHFAGEVAAVTEDGGEALLRERVASLDEELRQLLREALSEVA